IKQMRDWILTNALANEEELQKIEEDAKELVKIAKNAAWKEYLEPIKNEITEVVDLLNAFGNDEITAMAKELQSIKEPMRRDIHTAVRQALRTTLSSSSNERQALQHWLERSNAINSERYG